MDCDKMVRETSTYLRYLAKREDLIKNYEISLKYSVMSITIYSIHDDFVRHTLAYDSTLFTIRNMLEAMVCELKETEEYNKMIKQINTQYRYTTEITEHDKYPPLNTNKTTKERADNFIEKVIFNPPATIVFFKDGQKVVVKCQNGEEFDPEKGLAMAIIKKVYGLSVFNKMLDKAEVRYSNVKLDVDMSSLIDSLSDAAKRVAHILDGNSSIERCCKNCKNNKIDWSHKYEKDMPFCSSDNPMINHCKSISEDYEDFYCKDFEPKDEEK